MAAEWTAAARERFLAACGLDGSRPDLPRVKAPQGVAGRLFREMHVFNKKVSVPTPGRVILSEWQLRCNYLCLAAFVTEAERNIADDISRRSFLTSEARVALEEIWASCMRRERQAHARR